MLPTLSQALLSAALIQDVVYASLQSSCDSLDLQQLQEIRLTLESLQASPLRDELLQKIDGRLQSSDPSRTGGKQESNAAAMLRTVLSSMGIGAVANFPDTAACLSAIASVAAEFVNPFIGRIR